MSITSNKKKEIIVEHRLHKTDTGSAKVQVAILTERINNITEHLKIFRKDLHCKRGLLKLVNRRKKLLFYIKNDSESAYNDLTEKLRIRK
ncbi:MAG: 30S ribosomal protein S15 [Rickettsiaceae bacterium H1]|nr:30S ribosomal protein S15 [Rickettsiaceae bacterium H1]